MSKSTVPTSTKPKVLERMKLRKKWVTLHDEWLAKKALVIKAQDKLALALANLDDANMNLWEEVEKITGEGKTMGIEGEGGARTLVIYKSPKKRK